MGIDQFQTLLVASLVILGVVAAALLFVFQFVSRRKPEGKYEEKCRKCRATLDSPMETCPECGCEFPSAERQGGDTDSGDES